MDSNNDNNGNNEHISSPQRRRNNTKIILDLYTYIKLGIVSAIFIFLICNTIYAFALPKSDVACILDKAMQVTSPVNEFFAQNTLYKNILLITSSILIDFVLLSSAAYWILCSRSWRFLIAILIFYAVRAIVQSTFQLGFPEGYIWESPGFPSLVVGYAKTNDFFYSGHVGLPILAALEWYRNGFLYPMIGCLFVCLLEGFTVLITRTHYSIDIFAGIICAHYFYLLVDKYVKYIDRSFVGMKERKEPENGATIPEEYEKVEISDEDTGEVSSNGL